MNLKRSHEIKITVVSPSHASKTSCDTKLPVSLPSHASKTSLEPKNLPQLETFDPSTYEARILKVASEITIVDSMIFDDHSKLDLSSINSKSRDDWSHNSQSTEDSSLNNWVDNSRLLDETFSSFIS